jgi:hypothetical protein
MKNLLAGRAGRSSWLIPFTVFLGSACASVLAYYFAPRTSRTVQEQAAPTDSTRSIAFAIGDVPLRIPANYIPLPSARRGGSVKELDLVAILPDLRGYTLNEAQDFTANGVRVVAITLKADATILPEKEQLEQLYGTQIEDLKGLQGPFGLKQYAFREDSADRDKDLFIGKTENGPVVLLCAKVGPGNYSPECSREMPLMGDISLSYGFKREQLSQWRTIDTEMRWLTAAFAGQD